MVGTKCGWKQVLWLLCEAHLQKVGRPTCKARVVGRPCASVWSMQVENRVVGRICPINDTYIHLRKLPLWLPPS